VKAAHLVDIGASVVLATLLAGVLASSGLRETSMLGPSTTTSCTGRAGATVPPMYSAPSLNSVGA